VKYLVTWTLPFLFLLNVNSASADNVICTNDKLTLEITDNAKVAVFYNSDKKEISRYFPVETGDVYAGDFNPDNGVYFYTYFKESPVHKYFSISGTGVYVWEAQQFEASIHNIKDDLSFKDPDLKRYILDNEASTKFSCEIVIVPE